MKLHHLKGEVCPDCGARVKTEEQTSQHCNGEWFERRLYLCGAEQRWIPNFSRMQWSAPCPNSPEQLAEKQRLNMEAQKLVNYIRKSAFTADEQSKIFDRIRYACAFDNHIFNSAGETR
jgi:hypothetical protein